jgi:SAM-dependent methyltransferase
MNNHRYVRKGRWHKSIDLFKRGGAEEFIKYILSYSKYKVFRFFYPLIIFFKKKQTFFFQNQEYSYLFHRNNLTWRNERAIEVPIILSFVENDRGMRILEVGNVLSSYTHTDWEIVDKFEHGMNVLNVDVVDFSRPDTYDLIVSISTIEHVGYDDDFKDQIKNEHAINVLKSNLRKGGQLVVTCPIGYNLILDAKLADNIFGFTEEHFFVREGLTLWTESDKQKAISRKFGTPYPLANALFIGIFRRCV